MAVPARARRGTRGRRCRHMRGNGYRWRSIPAGQANRDDPGPRFCQRDSEGVEGRDEYDRPSPVEESVRPNSYSLEEESRTVASDDEIVDAIERTMNYADPASAKEF